MKFKKVTAENFKSIGPKPIEINLDFEDVKLLLGKNGSGKSTIFDSIIWCLYGYSRTKADGIINKTTKADTKVEIEFSENGKNYVVTRYRRHNEHGNNVYIFENDKPITLKGASQNQELINSIIGVDFRALSSSIILSSETYKNFLRERGSTRLEIFESVFSLKEINIFSKKNKLKIKESKNIKEKLDRELYETNSDLKVINGILTNSLETLKAEEAAKKERVKKLKRLIEEAEDKLKDSKITKLKEQLIQVKNEEKKFKELTYKKELFESNLKEKIETLTSKNKDLKKSIEREKFLNSIDFDKEEKLIEETNKFLKEKDDLTMSLVETKKQLDSDSREAEDLDLYLSKLLNKEINLRAENDNLEEEICPVCQAPIGEELHNKLRKENSEEIAKTEKIIEEHKFKLKKINQEIEDNEEKVKELNTQLEEIVNKEVSEFTIEEINSLKIELKFIKENKTSIPVDLSTEIENIKEKINALDLELKKFSYKEGKEEELENKIYSLERCKALLDNSIKELNEINNTKPNKERESYIKSLIVKMKEKKKEVEEKEISISKENDRLIELLTLEEIFSNKENSFKKFFIENTIKLFNDKINMFLPFFFDDEITITFDKNLVENITFRKKETEFEELSSGQKTRCELSIVFSMYFLVRSLFGNGSNLLVLDEILDFNLDKDGVNAVMKIVENFSKDSAVFIVSHRDEYKDRFDKVIKIYADDLGFTKIL